MNKSALLLFLSIICFLGCAKEQPKPPQQQVVGITSATVEAKDVPDTLQAVGTVEPKTEAVLSAKIMGVVTAFYTDEGRAVKKGDILLAIDAADIAAKKQEAEQARAEGLAALKETDAAMDEARAALGNADINYGRISSLYEEQAVTKKELDDMSTQHRMAEARVEQVAARKKQAEARIAQAEAAVKQSDVMLGYSVIRSPINGVVSAKLVNTGEMAAPGMPLLKVLDAADLRLAATVKESDAAGLRAGDDVKVTVDALAGRELAGSITEILPAADPATRSFRVKIDLPGTGGLKPGMFGRAWLPIGTRRAVLLPEGSLVDKEGMKGVYVVTPDSTLRFQAVSLGSEADGSREVLSGLSGGEEVAVGELNNIREGIKVSTK